MNPKKNGLIIKPVFIKKQDLADDDDLGGYETIFNADRDNKGKGIPADKLLKILKEINAEA